MQHRWQQSIRLSVEVVGVGVLTGIQPDWIDLQLILTRSPYLVSSLQKPLCFIKRMSDVVSLQPNARKSAARKGWHGTLQLTFSLLA